MPEFGTASKNNLKTCHPDIQRVLNEAIKVHDFTVLEGYRNQERQDYLYSINRSKVKYPNGKHNTMDSDNKPLSNAVDVVPYPAMWKATIKEFFALVYFLKGIAWGLGIKLYSGADWDDDEDFNDQTFNDYAHLELRI